MSKLWTGFDISLFHCRAVWSLSVTESKTHVSPIDGLTTIQLVSWKQILIVGSLSICCAVRSMIC
jgi:hypothetical protein